MDPVFGVMDDATYLYFHNVSQSLRINLVNKRVFSRGKSSFRNNHTEILKDIISTLGSAPCIFLPDNSIH